MNNSLISIIVPIYNSELYLSKMLDSINMQTYDNYEVILINDGSTDNSKNICINYAENNCRIIYIEKENTGVSDTRNLGISKAKGNYICFVDSDDVLNKDYLTDLYSIINDKQSELVCCRYNKFFNEVTLKEDENILEISKKYMDNNKYNMIFEEYGGYLFNKIFIKDIIVRNNIKFSNEIYMCEDMIFILEYLKYVDKVECINKNNYNYRINFQSASKNIHNKNWFSIFKALDEMIKFGSNVSKETFNKIIYTYIFKLYEGKYRLKFNKSDESYNQYRLDLNNRISSLKEKNFELDLQQKIKIFVYKYFNLLAFTIKFRKETKK